MNEGLKEIVAFPQPRGGASLILAFRLESKTTLIIGSGSLAASRAFSALEADSNVIILSKGGLDSACEEIQWRTQRGQLTLVDWNVLPGSSRANADDRDTQVLDSYLKATPGIRFVCVTDTALCTQRRNQRSAEQIYQLCKARNILVNITDVPELCDFTFTSSHRFEDPESGEPMSLQIGVTTNGKGCRLAGRLKREIVSKLPREVGAAVEKMGQMRVLAKAYADQVSTKELSIEEGELCNEDHGAPTPNLPVPARSRGETEAESARRRMNWLAQVSEYWPIPKLASMSQDEMQEVLAGESSSSSKLSQKSALSSSVHSLAPSRYGRILLVGSGPGHPSLLTLATHTALTQLADLVLSDKLVPDAVLALVPKRVEVRIAKKFPGNAEGAQIEMMETAVEAAKRGLTVVRLKQGDPVVYGRAGEEILYFRVHGFEPLVIPGISSALAGPMFAGIPVTQRGVAESFIVCTGVGRKGKDVQLPGYERSRTLVILMGVARITQVVKALVDPDGSDRRSGAAYPSYTPIAIIERASMPDQRVISSTLENLGKALESVGEQRPPGMIVVGWAVLALWGQGEVGVLDEVGVSIDRDKVSRWLSGNGVTGWRVRTGLDRGWEGLTK